MQTRASPPLLHAEDYEAAAALFGFRRGVVGALAGPYSPGNTVQVLQPVNLLVFDEAEGQAVMFPVTSVFLPTGIPPLRRLSAGAKQARR